MVMKWKECLKPKRVGLALAVGFSAFLLSSLFFFFCLENLNLELYITNVQ
jgi:hypothetical protein